jgi:8-oxo-dGTP diphosphatase
MTKEVFVVAAVIENERKEILCALRSETMPLPNVWEFPGGKVEKGENPKEALKREIREELGCLIEVHEKVAETRYGHIYLHTYNAAIKEGTPKAKEHAEIRWMPISKLSSLRWAPADLPTVEALLEKNR